MISLLACNSFQYLAECTTKKANQQAIIIERIIADGLHFLKKQRMPFTYPQSDPIAHFMIVIEQFIGIKQEIHSWSSRLEGASSYSCICEPPQHISCAFTDRDGSILASNQVESTAAPTSTLNESEFVSVPDPTNPWVVWNRDYSGTFAGQYMNITVHCAHHIFKEACQMQLAILLYMYSIESQE